MVIIVPTYWIIHLIRCQVQCSKLAFAQSQNGNGNILRRCDCLIVWLVTPNVCHWIDAPRDVQDPCVTETSREEPSVRPRFVPIKYRNYCRQNKAAKRHDDCPIILLKHQNRIGFQVGNVDFLSSSTNIRMLLRHQPANMWEKESPSSIVRVSICVKILVMDSVISRPVNDAVLKSDRVENHQHQTQWPLGFVGAMWPESVNTSSDSWRLIRLICVTMFWKVFLPNPDAMYMQ